MDAPITPQANRLAATSRGTSRAPLTPNSRAKSAASQNNAPADDSEESERADEIMQSARAWRTGGDRKIMFAGPGGVGWYRIFFRWSAGIYSVYEFFVCESNAKLGEHCGCVIHMIWTPKADLRVCVSEKKWHVKRNYRRSTYLAFYFSIWAHDGEQVSSSLTFAQLEPRINNLPIHHHMAVSRLLYNATLS